MKPLYLKMEAFGSYGKEEFIDFRKPTQNLFLITGDTGSGKTTIFDAMVFALYGEASSNANKKSGVILQSQFAREDAVPRVEFAFEEIEDGEAVIYKVIRTPDHIRPTKRKTKNGASTIKENGKAELILPDGSAYNKEKNPDRKIAEIVGLSKSQFMQVAMIAQGEFMDLLRANSDVKKEIFRKLFHTELYQKMVEILSERRKIKVGEMAALRNSTQEILNNVIVPDWYKEWEEYEEYEKVFALVKDGNMSQMPGYLPLLSVMNGISEQEKSRMDEICQKESEELTAKQAEYTNAKTWWEIYEKYQLAKDTWTRCQADEKTMEEQAVWIGQVEKALEIMPFEKMYLDAQMDYQKTKAKLATVEETYPLAMEALEVARQEKTDYQAIYEESQEEYLKVEQKVKEAKAIFHEISANEKKAKRYQNRLTKLSQKKKEQEDLLKKAIVGKEKAQAARKTYRTAEVDYGSYKEKALKYREKNQDWTQTQAKVEEGKRMAAEILQKRAAYEDLAARHRKAKYEYEKLDQLFLDAQVGILAGKLTEGSPCPVCGSLEHPSPACHQAEMEIPTEEAVKEARDRKDQLNDQLHSAATGIKLADNNYEALEKQIAEEIDAICQYLTGLVTEIMAIREGIDRHYLEEKISWRWALLPEEALIMPDHLSIEEQIEKIESFKAQTYAALLDVGNHCVSAVKAYKQAVDDEEVYSQEEKKNRETLEATKKELTDSEKDYLSIQTLLESLKEKKSFENQEAAERVMQKAETVWRESKRLKEAKDSKEAAALQNMESQKASLAQLKELLPLQETKWQEKAADYQKSYKNRGFSMEEEWKSYASWEARSQLPDKKEEYESFKETKARAKTQMDTNENLLHLENGQKAPLDTILKEVKALEDKLHISQEKKNEMDRIVYANRNAYDRLMDSQSQREACNKEYQTIVNLYGRIAGKVSGENKMDLETFVQRYYLEQILVKANRRFEKLSAGQFRLMIKDVEEAGKGKNEGLDLMVYSMVTGKRNEIRSLSGGESFMAALSLALGMADQIQEQSSALQLDMMFIDEGFGSLSENGRNQAIRILKEMAGGNKLIGIISHVTELKQELENQLVITKDDQGSHSSWRIS